jgi:low affinity Fe/Cu permease
MSFFAIAIIVLLVMILVSNETDGQRVDRELDREERRAWKDYERSPKGRERARDAKRRALQKIMDAELERATKRSK